ncbi:MAG: Sensor histidine kinase RcsC [Herbaspirillum frisingense]|uniref:Sensor histidine kinase RcsC n=1 Tax=Herbaspirillum frisingense TaxID=92645 RepID=A0A7V8FU55_9BURK|nr:MAG: Sensor histidine kinase RcsC [Herbaspirillum frisingense]
MSMSEMLAMKEDQTMNAMGPRILVVEDSATSRLAIQKSLHGLGCQVQCAEDGASALAAMHAGQYGMVLLDCYLPDMTGDGVARRVRAMEAAEPERAYTPLIGISAEANEARVRLCLDSGMDGILDKPLSLDAIRKLLAVWCDHETDDTIEDAQTASVADLEKLFGTTSQQDLQAMRAAHAASDADAIGRLAHRMKGAALAMNRPAVVQALDRIEESVAAGTVQPIVIGLLIAMLARTLEA